MRYAVVWSPAALQIFYRLAPHTAMIVDRAVIGFAERGEGHLQWAPPYYRLRAGMHELALRVDVPEQTIHVLYLYAPR